MATLSEDYYLQLYKDALTIKPENIDELIKLLSSPKTLFNDTLLAKLGVVTTAEWREIDERSRGGRLAGRNERRAKNLIGKVIDKHSLKSYRGLRKFIAKQAPQQTEIIAKVFPFGADEDKDGLTPEIRHRATPEPPASPVQHTATPTILWMTLTQAEFDDAKKALQHIAHGSEKIPSQCNLFLEKLTIPLPDYSLHDEATLFLACPKVELCGPDPFKPILANFTPRPHFALLTGPCQPLQGSEFTSPDSLNNVQAVVVTSTRAPLPIEGEVQYFTELMKLKGEIENLCVSFGGAAKTMDQYEGCTVYYPKAKLFYAAAQQFEGLEYLSIAQVCKNCAIPVDSYYLYVCNILKSIANEL